MRFYTRLDSPPKAACPPRVETSLGLGPPDLHVYHCVSLSNGGDRVKQKALPDTGKAF